MARPQAARTHFEAEAADKAHEHPRRSNAAARRIWVRSAGLGAGGPAEVAGRWEGRPEAGRNSSWRVMFSVTFAPESMRGMTDKQREKLERASEMDLRYEYFWANIQLAAGGLGVEEFPGTPVLDFMFCLLLSSQEIREGNAGCVAFTESDVVIVLAPSGETLTISRSWDPVAGNCTIAEFLAGVSRFSGETLEYIARRYPAFQEHPTHRKLMDMLEQLG
ncbi:hypothetical protein ACWFRM_03105 [Streptomyces sp. NPDC055144]